MTITVGKDTAKTRKTLKVGDQSVAYYSIPAAQAAGLGDFSKLPAALKVVLENLLRFEDDGFRSPSMTSRRSLTGPTRVVRTRAKSPIALPGC